jgi:hypothetical protein
MQKENREFLFRHRRWDENLRDAAGQESVRLRKKGKVGEKGKKPREFLVFPSSHFAFVTQEPKANTMGISTEKRTNPIPLFA